MSRKGSEALIRTGVETPRNTEDLGKESISTAAPKIKKSKSSTLRRAFSWLRGKRKKKKKNEDVASKGGEKKSKAEVKTGKSKSKGGAPKHEDENKLSVHYNASQHQQENVFFPATRQPYLEDLHLEAQEGLLSLQQQEKQKLVRHGIDVPDNTSVQSSQVDAEMEFRGRSQSFVAENTVEDSLAIRSEMIQRRGSTFKPHANAKKAGTKPERERKPRRTTIVGIPQHVAKELGFNKVQHAKVHEGIQIKPEYSDSISLVGLPSQQNSESNHTGDTVHIPTVNGAVQENILQGPGVRVSLQNIEARQPLVNSESEADLQKHIQKVYYDDLHLGWRTAAKMSPQLRPKSLAVPGMTTGNFHNDRPSPVMLISPQATYLSKIVPNAVLPASVDLVAISRNSVRTLSRASLVAPSPASVRSCIQFSIQNYDSRHHSSSSENWSHSQSTETIVSNSSTISSKGSHGGVFCKNGVTVENNQKSYNEFQKPLMDQLKVTNIAQNSHGFLLANQTGSSSINTDLSPACSVSSVADTSDTASIKSGRSFRNLSVRKVKKIPAPPKRTYSLLQQETNVKEHKSLKKDVSVPVDGLGPSADDALSPNCLSETSSVQSESLTYSADYSSSDVSRCSESPLVRNQLVKKDLNFKGQQLPHDFSPQKLNDPDKFDRTMSPSSGYSSQSGTPTLSTKGLISYPPSPGKKRALPTKPERTCSLQSPAVSVSSSLTSLSSAASDPVPTEQMTTSMGVPITSEVTTVMTTTVSVTAMSNSTENDAIPPHPKVSAPQSPPPPEVRDKATSMLTVINASMSRKPSMSKRIKEKLAAVSVSASPPPSPPPSHQPPPPPVKNEITVSEAAVAPSSLLPSPCLSSEVAQIPKVEPSWPLPPPPALEELVTSKERLPTSSEMDFPPPPVQKDSSSSIEKEHFSVEKLPNMLPSVFPSVTAEAKTVVDNVTHPTTDKGSLEIAPQEDSVASQPAIPTPPPPPPLPSMLQPICSDSNHAKNISASLLPKTYLPVPFTKLPEQKQLEMQVPEPIPPPAPSPPPPPFLKTSGQLQRSFQKRASTSSYTGTKEQVPRSKSMLPAKEDASLPIVTPSLLQMVRLRSVNVNNHGSENTGKKLDDQSQQNGEESDSQNSAVPQKPLRKSLSLKVSTSSDPVPSMQLQNAVRLKTSSLPYKNFPGPLSPKPFDKDRFAKSSIPAGTGSPTNASPVPESSSPKLNEEGSMYKSSAQTASFIFAKSPRKVVFETPNSPEAQSELKKNLVAELMTVSGQRSTVPGPIALSNQQSTETNSKPPIQKKPTKAPPPVARKPVHLPSTLQPQIKSPVSPHPDSPNQPLSPDNTAEYSTNEQNRTNTGLSDDHTKAMHSLGQETQTSQTKANEETGNTAKPPS